MSLTVIREFREDEPMRRAFDALARQIFGLSFEAWYQQGYWTDRYRPYLLVQDGVPVACAAANLQDLCWDGRVHRCVQIGTVMTAPTARGQGFARRLIGEILQDWRSSAEFIFLFSNPAATSFYEALGFVRRPEYRWHSTAVTPTRCQPVTLDLELSRDRELLWAHTLEGNPFAALTLHRGYELLLFHLMRDPALRLLFLPQSDSIAVLKEEEERLCCLDLLGGHGTLQRALEQLGQPGEIPLGFAPHAAADFSCQPSESGDVLLVLPGGEEPPFAAQHLCLPALAHS